MSVADSFSHCGAIITEGAVIERLRRDPTLELDPQLLNAALVYSDSGRAQLGAIYREYLDVGREYDLPMILFTPTWRANVERCAAGGHGADNVNAEGYRFLSGIRAEYAGYVDKVWIGGLTGCRGDAYKTCEALSETEAARFHRPQVEALAASGVDFLMAATLPAVSEALGIARAMGDCGLPYFLSFVVRPTGTLLDGTLIGEAVRRIDSSTQTPPLGYWANCVHPTVFAAALENVAARDPAVVGRVIGLQANTSARSPEELEGRAELDSEAPDVFARGMLGVRRRFGTRILGGCCGTDDRHIRALAAGLTAAPRPAM